MFIVTSETIWIDRASFIAAIINGLVLLMTLVTQLYYRNKKEKTLLRIKIFNVFAILTIFCGITFCIQKMFASFGIFSDSDEHCKLHVTLGALFWLSMKHSMYICFIIRLHIAFKDSTFQFTSKMFVFLYLLIIISYTTQLVAYIVFGNGKLHIDYDNNNNIPYCISVCPFWIRCYNAFCDLVLSILLCVLFVKRLFKAFVLSQQFHSDSVIQSEISKIAQYITLSIIGIVTTFIALILFGSTTWFVWISVDIIINCWCIFLIFKVNVKLFNNMCCFCHKCVGYSFYKIMDWKDMFAEKPHSTTVEFEKHSFDHKEMAILTRTSFCKVYNIGYQCNVAAQNMNEMLEEDNYEHSKSDETILNLETCEMITVPSRSDTVQ